MMPQWLLAAMLRLLLPLINVRARNYIIATLAIFFVHDDTKKWQHFDKSFQSIYQILHQQQNMVVNCFAKYPVILVNGPTREIALYDPFAGGPSN